MFNTSNIYRPEGLGLVATSRRNIRHGREYAKFFAAAKSENKVIKGDADVTDTVAHALKMIKRDAPSMLRLAKYLQRSTIEETSCSFFNYMYWHYQYKIDTPGQEQLRTCARAYQDRFTGIDCDCYSISVGTLLTALNIPFVLRIIKMDNKAYYQHIYVIVPKFKGANLNIHSNYWVIDPVLDKFDKEAPYTAKSDYYMELAELSGINPEGTDIGREFDGFGETCEGTIGTYHKRMKNHIVNTRNAIAKSPEKVKGFYNPHKFVQIADTVIKHWDNDSSREKALAWASDVEMGMVDDDMQGLQGIMHGDENGYELHDYLGNDNEYLEAMSGWDLTGGLGKIKSKKAKMESAKSKIAAPAAKANKTKKGFFTKIKNGGKAITAEGKKPHKGLVKKVFKLTQKVNPAAVAIRAAVLAAMKLNVGKYSAKLKLAYGSQSDAEKAGFNYGQIVKAKNQIEKLFTDLLGGNADKLKQAIITHKTIFHKGNKGNASEEVEGVFGLGVVVAAAAGASVVAASPFLAKIAAILKGILQNPKVKEKLMQAAKTAGKSIANKVSNKEASNQASDAASEGNFIPAAPTNQNSDSGNSQFKTDKDGNLYNDKGETVNEDGSPATKKEGKSNTMLIVGGVVVAGIAAIALSGGFSGHKSASTSVGSVKQNKKSTQVYL